LPTHFGVAAKKTDPFVLRDAPVSLHQEVIDEFHKSRGLKEKLAAAEKLLAMAEPVSWATKQDASRIFRSVRVMPVSFCESLMNPAGTPVSVTPSVSVIRRQPRVRHLGHIDGSALKRKSPRCPFAAMAGVAFDSELTVQVFAVDTISQAVTAGHL
jgi:hypothetical protein